jgi:hypothetical protein
MLTSIVATDYDAHWMKLVRSDNRIPLSAWVGDSSNSARCGPDPTGPIAGGRKISATDAVPKPGVYVDPHNGVYRLFGFQLGVILESSSQLGWHSGRVHLRWPYSKP